MIDAHWRWIAYTQQNIPGNVSFQLSRHESLIDATDAVQEFSEAVMSDECSATLYAYSDGRWAEAVEYDGIGCPFDYPDRIIERGPRGGWKVEHT